MWRQLPLYLRLALALIDACRSSAPTAAHADGAALREYLQLLPQTHAAYRAIINLGFTEAIRATTDAADVYTFWDYTAGAWLRNEGIRIDHLLLSPQAADRLKNATVDRHVRSWEKPSDHVPVRIDLS